MRFSQKNYWTVCHCQLVICTKVAQRDIRINKLEIPDYGPALGLNSFHSLLDAFIYCICETRVWQRLALSSLSTPSQVNLHTLGRQISSLCHLKLSVSPSPLSNSSVLSISICNLWHQPPCSFLCVCSLCRGQSVCLAPDRLIPSRFTKISCFQCF